MCIIERIMNWCLRVDRYHELKRCRRILRQHRIDRQKIRLMRRSFPNLANKEISAATYRHFGEESRFADYDLRERLVASYHLFYRV